MKSRSETGRRRKPGVKPDLLKLDGSWEDAIGKAIKKERPAGGWPKATRRPYKRKPKPS